MERWSLRVLATIALSCIGFLIVLVFLSKFPGALHHLCLSSSEMSYSLRTSVPLALSAVSTIALIGASHPLRCLIYCAHLCLSPSRLSQRLRSPVPLALSAVSTIALTCASLPLGCLNNCAHLCPLVLSAVSFISLTPLFLSAISIIALIGASPATLAG
jgi:hypothetical protein